MSLESGEAESLLEQREPARSWGRVFRTATAVSFLLVWAVASFQFGPKGITKMGNSLIGLSEDPIHKCDGLPFIKLEKVISSNLGKKGPDFDAEEGIFYKARAYHPEGEEGIDDDADLEMHVHALESFDEKDEDEGEKYDNSYVPAFTKGDYVNGINGRFAVISVKPNKKVKVRVHAYDANAKKDVAVPHGFISFFDLDTGKAEEEEDSTEGKGSEMFDCSEGVAADWEKTRKQYCCLAHQVGCADDDSTYHPGLDSVEHVEVCDYDDYFLSDTTEVAVRRTDEHGKKCATFTATQVGTGDDNPDDPMNLTKQQVDRAVTLKLDGVSEFNFEIGASKGRTGRVFTFVFRPVLECTKIKNPPAAKGQGRDEKDASYRTTPAALAVLGLTAYFF